MSNAHAFNFNPFKFGRNKKAADQTKPDLNTEETTMNDNVHPLNENADIHGAGKKADPLADAVHAAAGATADAAAGAAENVADAAAAAAEEVKAKVSTPGFFATRTGRIVKGVGIVAGAGLVAGAGYVAYRALNAVTDGAVGEAVGEAAEASGEAVAEAAEQVVAAIFNR